jgi:ribosomal protein L37AE/L43A
MNSDLLNVRDSRDILHECPKCSRKALSQVEAGVYECIWCGFRRNISRSQGGFFATAVTVGGVIFLIALL